MVSSIYGPLMQQPMPFEGMPAVVASEAHIHGTYLVIAVATAAPRGDLVAIPPETVLAGAVLKIGPKL